MLLCCRLGQSFFPFFLSVLPTAVCSSSYSRNTERMRDPAEPHLSASRCRYVRLDAKIPLLTTVTRSLTVKLAIVVSAGRDESTCVLGGEGDKRAQVILKLPLAMMETFIMV